MHKHLIYGRTSEGGDTLLPGYVSRPNPSPKFRLLEPSSEVSPAIDPCTTANPPAPGPGPKRRLRLDEADKMISTQTLSAAGKQAHSPGVVAANSPSTAVKKQNKMSSMFQLVRKLWHPQQQSISCVLHSHAGFVLFWLPSALPLQ
jgi:hypothetical protein